MILVDAVYINNSGGKILLDFLVEVCERNSLDVFYLLDDRCSLSYTSVPRNRKLFIKASLINRLGFYLKSADRFHTVLCFGNLPPIQKINAKVYTYFHQALYLKVPEGLNVSKRLKLSMKVLLLKLIKGNSDYWIVQGELIKTMLVKKYRLRSEDVLRLPFYPPIVLDTKQGSSRIKYSYIYVSNVNPHKNHRNLIQAFCDFYDETKHGVLTLTIPHTSKEMIALVGEKIACGYPIDNIGFISRSELFYYYQTHEYLIYPSLAESFGLGLVEAIECGCKVIGADLPYTYEVCEPSISFDPSDVGSIKNAFRLSMTSETPSTVQKISNEIDALIQLLKYQPL